MRVGFSDIHPTLYVVSPWWNRLDFVLFGPWRTGLPLPETTYRAGPLSNNPTLMLQNNDLWLQRSEGPKEAKDDATRRRFYYSFLLLQQWIYDLAKDRRGDVGALQEKRKKEGGNRINICPYQAWKILCSFGETRKLTELTLRTEMRRYYCSTVSSITSVTFIVLVTLTKLLFKSNFPNPA